MTIARKRQIELTITPYYHCIARCVRRAYLCGSDKLTGKDFSHRRGWILEQLKRLSSIFAINICAYAIMSNHYHVVLHVDTHRAKAWTAQDVVERWSALFTGNPLIKKYRSGELLTENEQFALNILIEQSRNNLTNISWFMRCMNEKIARLANAEDDCRGHFWEGRFKSQALLDIKALLTCMVYVDLNPIRAGISDSLDSSDFTSVQERLFALAKKTSQCIDENEIAQPPSLVPFSATETNNIHSIIPIPLRSYLELADITGRAIRTDKPGYIPENIMPILQQLDIDPFRFIKIVKNYKNFFKSVSGSIVQLRKFNQFFGKKWSKGLVGSRLLYSKAA